VVLDTLTAWAQPLHDPSQLRQHAKRAQPDEKNKSNTNSLQ
jgi:hypothetical protein